MPTNITAEIRCYTKHPNAHGHIYWGNIHRDTKERWADGSSFHTSQVVKEEDNGDHIIVTTYNSVYKLMKDQSFEALIKEKNNGAREAGSSEASS